LFVHAEHFRPFYYSKLTSEAFPLHANQAQRQVVASVCATKRWMVDVKPRSLYPRKEAQ
jgi:hypothetical protein